VKSHTVKVSKRYQIAVPSVARERLNIHSGDRLIVDIQDGMLVLLPEPLCYTETLAGLHKDIWEKIDGQEYVIQERQSWVKSPKG
jgi:AbrB family looped-hinge helix DNA binding protein